jgi:drug/metabolite transporter (DMT)-like permease
MPSTACIKESPALISSSEPPIGSPSSEMLPSVDPPNGLDVQSHIPPHAVNKATIHSFAIGMKDCEGIQMDKQQNLDCSDPEVLCNEFIDLVPINGLGELQIVCDVDIHIQQCHGGNREFDNEHTTTESKTKSQQVRDPSGSSRLVESLEAGLEHASIYKTVSSHLVIPLPVTMSTTETESTTTAETTPEDTPSKLLNANMGRLLILLAAALYGTNFGLVKMLDDQLHLAFSASLRFGLAAVIVTSALWIHERIQDRASSMSSHSRRHSDDNNISPLPLTILDDTTNSDTITIDENHLSLDRWKSLLRGLEVGIWYAVGYWCQAQGLSLVKASKSAFFNALAVLVVPLLDWTFHKKPLRAMQWLAVVSALLGVGLLEFAHDSSEPSGTTEAVSSTWSYISLGDVYSLLQALFFGIGYWRLEDASRQHPQQAARITVGQLLAVAGCSWMYWVATSLWNQQSIGIDFVTIPASLWTEPWIWGALVWTGLVSTALALFLETIALRAVSAAELTMLMTTMALWGSAFAYVALGEVLPPLGWVGGFLILGSCVLSTQRKK